MKKRVCFTGFPGGEVSALQAAINIDAPWDCRFVPDAKAALVLLDQETCDVFVADMATPGEQGASLLREVGRRYPKMLRFIAGDVAGQELIANSIGGSHQFIRRPFEPAELIRTIQRGLKLDAWLSNDALRELTPRLRRLPSLPSTYFNLLKEVESPAATLQTIGEVIARDPVVTARLLQVVNSAAFSPAQKVSQAMDAVGLLGVQTVKSLVLCLQIFGQQDAARETGLSLEILWEHSFLVAKFARLIVLKQTGNSQMADDAFTAGLLHDVGRIVIASNLPEEYTAVVAAARQNCRPLHEEETTQLGASHAKVGAYLLGLWGLPAPLIEATAAHHGPGQTVFAREFSLLAAVHAANVFAHTTSGQTDGLPLPELDLEYYQTLKLDHQLVAWRDACIGESAPAPSESIEKSPTQSIANPAESTRIAAGSVARTAPAKALQFGWLWKLAAAGILVLAVVLVWYFFHGNDGSKD
jgi:HD-like signal output (HDOD) protein